MAVNQKPIIGTWYINLSGQFLRAWAVIYDHGQPSEVVIHYLNGMRFIVSLEDWYKLDLECYPHQDEECSGVTQA